MSISAGASAPTQSPVTHPIDVRRSSAKAKPKVRDYLLELRSRKELVRVLVSRELRSQYEMNVIGFAWWLLEPLTLTAVYLLVVVAFGITIPDYPLFVLCALLPFKWLVSGLVGSIGTVRLNGQLVTDVYFPRALLPLVENLVGLAHFMVGLAIIPIFMFGFGRPPTINALWLPVVMAVQFLLILAFSYPMSVWGLYYRNVQNLSNNILRLWFYTAPGIWALDRLQTHLAETYSDAHVKIAITLVKLNPLTGLFLAYRGALYEGKAPGWELGYTAGVSVVVLVLGFRYFIRREAQFGKLV